jgi:tetratricopeptide (TPR) repeat protein
MLVILLAAAAIGSEPAAEPDGALAPTVRGSARPAAAPIRSARGGDDLQRCASPTPDEAVRACSAILGGHPAENVRLLALRNRGFAYQMRGEPDRAIADYGLVVQLSTPAPAGEARSWLAKTYLNRGVARAMKGDESGASSDYASAISLDRGLVGAYVNRAAILMKRRDWDAALADLNAAAQLDASDPSIFVSRGSVHVARSESGLAIEDFTSAVRLDPRNALAWRLRANAYRVQGDLVRAGADSDEAVRLASNSAAAQQEDAFIRAARGDLQGAVRALTTAMTWQRRDPQLAKARGDLYMRMAQYDLAIADYTTAVTLDWRSAPAYSDRAAAHLAKGLGWGDQGRDPGAGPRSTPPRRIRKSWTGLCAAPGN